MAVNLTEEQMLKIGKLAEIATGFAEQLKVFMKGNGLDKIDGARISLDIDPSFDMCETQVEFGYYGYGDVSDVGYLRLVKGKEDRFYDVSYLSSKEYEGIFKPIAVRETICKAEDVGADSVPGNHADDSDGNRDPVDCGVSVDEGMAQS